MSHFLPAELHRLCGWDEVVTWCSLLPVALYSLQTFLQVVQVGRRRGGAGVCMRRGVGVCVVFLLVQLSGLFELRQLTVEHVGGGGHRRLRGQQGGDGRSLLRLVLASSETLLQVDRGQRCVHFYVHTMNISQEHRWPVFQQNETHLFQDWCRSKTNFWLQLSMHALVSNSLTEPM